MNSPFNHLHKMLTEEEKEKLKFTADDRKTVFRKIKENKEPPKRKGNIVQTAAAYVLAPVALAIVTLAVLLQTPLKQEVVTALPYLETFLSKYGDEGQKEAVKENKVQVINQSVVSEGARITIHEVLYDGARISISYSLEPEDDKLKESLLDVFLFNISVDGEEVSEYGLSGGEEKKQGNKIIKVQNLEIEKDLPNQFILGFNIQELIASSPDNMESQFIKGEWNFSFPIKRIGEIYTLNPNTLKTTELGEVKVNKIALAPSGVLLEIERKQKSELINNGKVIDYKLLDEEGNELKQIGGTSDTFRYKSGFGTGAGKRIYTPVEDIPESITLKPYYRFLPMDQIKEYTTTINGKLPLYLPQGEGGGIVVKKVEKKPNEVWVYFDVEGDFVTERKFNLSLRKGKETTPASIIDSEGDLDNKKRKNQLIKFKTSYNDDLYFRTTNYIPEWVKGWELKIPIDKDQLSKE